MSDTPTTSPSGASQDRCWRRVGVWGDQTCPDLPAVVHCHNCSVYKDTGRGLLDRPPPEGWVESWRQALASSATQPRNAHTVLVFRLADEWLALPLRAVLEVTESRPAHRLPHRRDAVVSGVVAVRGELHIQVCLKALLQIPEGAPTQAALRDAPRLVLFERASQPFAFRADAVEGIVPVADEALRPPPSTVSRALATFTRHVFSLGERNVGLLDDDLLVQAITKNHL